MVKIKKRKKVSNKKINEMEEAFNSRWKHSELYTIKCANIPNQREILLPIANEIRKHEAEEIIKNFNLRKSPKTFFYDGKRSVQVSHLYFIDSSIIALIMCDYVTAKFLREGIYVRIKKAFLQKIMQIF